jgi:prolyl oligopeptidase
MTPMEARPRSVHPAAYPVAPRTDCAEVLHGTPVPDPYRALEEDGGSTLEWVRAQQLLARDRLDRAPGRAWFASALARLQDLPQRSVPTVRGARAFYTDRARGTGSWTLCVREADGSSSCLVDPAEWGAGSTARITAWNASPDGSLLAFQVCAEGTELGALRVLDVATRTVVAEVADDLRAPSVAWAGPDGERPSGLYYPRAGSGSGSDEVAAGLYLAEFATGRHRAVWRADRTDQPVFCVPAVSPGGDRLLLAVRYGADPRNALLTADPGTDRAEFRLLVPAGRAATTVRFGPDGRAVVLTQLGSDRGRICVIDPADPDPDAWRELCPGDDRAVVRAFVPLGGRVAVLRSRDGVAEVGVVDTASGAERLIPLPEDCSVSAMTGSAEAGGLLWIAYAQAARPPAVLEVSLAGAATREWFGAGVAAPELRVRSERIACTSADGTEIAVSILGGTAEDEPGPRPMILSVYGGFGVVAQRTFRPETRAWILAGGVHAVAHVRGGGEHGASWHEAGRGVNKPRAVEDLIAAAEQLIASGRTTPGQLALFGASNGGLLASAAAVRRPDLFRACVPVHAVTDMLRYRELGDGRAWVAEYGDPEQSEAFAALLSYSPYHNVAPGLRYPAFLLMAGTADQRVPPAHSRKLCAALQAATAGSPDTAPVLLREQDQGGHGTIPADHLVTWTTDRLSFLADCLGLAVPTVRSGTEKRSLEA